MPVFISYSHKDKAFVDQLFGALIYRNIHVWLDRVELKVGDSLLTKIQGGLEQAPALLVVLSKSSVESGWCKRELNAALMRELEEKKILVLPILIEKCEVPLFLREKVYADFTSTFDEPFERLLSSLAERISANLGRGSSGDHQYDWALDWGFRGQIFTMKLVVVVFSTSLPYSVLIEVEMRANGLLTSRYLKYEQAGLDWVGRLMILEFCAGLASNPELSLVIKDNKQATRNVRVGDGKTGYYCDVEILARRLGIDTGQDVFMHINAIYDSIHGVVKQNSRQLNSEELVKVGAILSGTA